MLQGIIVDDTMSNLTSAISNEASISSTNNLNEIGTTNMFSQQNPKNPVQPALRKKRNLPGNPDPDAEVVALSPRTLMATNRFVCEICNKGFQRDQNLQLHRRGHNLPWKLKQRNKNEVIRKKVYICPEPSCVHHEPSRALGDLTGIKKHFSRKHGEKKWKCEKCSKRYAVQSDWKAHSKICGTREYRCDCGTLFSRRDSFITHRAFCDALAEESSKSMNTLLVPQTAPNHVFPLIPSTHLKQENPNFNLPPWLSSSDHLFNMPRVEQSIHQENPNPNNTTSFSSSLMSATALLQKAAQMGVTMSMKLPSDNDQSILIRPHHHVSAPGFCATSSTTTATAGLASREEMGMHGLSSFGNKVGDNVTAECMEFQDHMNNMLGSSSHLPSTSGFDVGSSDFAESYNQMLNTANRSMSNAFQDNHAHNLMNLRKGENGGGDGMTRDFLGLRGFPHRDFVNMAGLDQMAASSSYDHHQQPQNQAPWGS